MLGHINRSIIGALLIQALFVELVAGTVSGAAFRLSFLEQEPVLSDTCQLLRETGFSEDSVASFKKLVQQHNLRVRRVDRTKFPAPHEGYYEFRDLGDLTNRLPALLHWTPIWPFLDQRSFTCFDAACMLLRGAGCGSPDFEKDLPSRGILLSTNGPKTFRSDYAWTLFPKGDYEDLVGKPRSEAETQLVLSMRATRGLVGPNPTNEMAWCAAFATFVRGMKDGGFSFPQKFKLGLGFYVNVNWRCFGADHAFICIPRGNRVICLEKNGCPGPYVRAEFESEEELARYISWPMLEDAKNPKLMAYGSPVIVSLNDRLLGVYVPALQP
jgi:hypothetical protein